MPPSVLELSCCFIEIPEICAGANSPFRIQTWALEEARRRLEAEGILEDPEKAQRK